MELEIKKLSTNAVLPIKTISSDAGFDLTIIKKYKIVSDTTVGLSTGIAVNIPKGYYGLIKERSSSASDNLLSISGGIIDAGYTGEIFILVTNLSSGPVFLNPGYKIAQLIINKLPAVRFKEVKEFTENTVRGDKAFGSTN